MKKRFLIIILLIGFTGFGQLELLDEQPKTTISVHAGWLQSTLKGDDLGFLAVNNKINSYNGYFAGISVHTPINKYIGLKHEIFYQNYGAKFERNLDGTLLDAKLEMHGIWVNLTSLTFNYEGFQIYAGPFLNMMPYSSITAIDEAGNIYKDHEIYGTETDDQEEGYFLQKTDFGMVLGAEYQFPFGMLAGAKFTRGFFRIFDNSNTYAIESETGRKDLNIYNQNFGIYLGYRF